MLVIGLEIELHLPGRGSLKEKRKTVRALRDRLPARYGAAVAEVGWHELHQRCALGVALVGGTVSDVQQREQDLLNDLRRQLDLELLSVKRFEQAPDLETGLSQPENYVSK